MIDSHQINGETSVTAITDRISSKIGQLDALLHIAHEEVAPETWVESVSIRNGFFEAVLGLTEELGTLSRRLSSVVDTH